MCGFVGIINKDGSGVSPEILEKMADAIHHRGPDEEGIFINDNCGFYHKRLSIIDLNTGQQPMTFGNYTIVFNGEIYNYIELREELRLKGHEFVTTSDTEVILHLYQEYGESFVNRLNGMFAFLIHDQTKNHIYAARDHFGIKPFYYAIVDSTFYFASEIKAILPFLKEISTDIEGIKDYLTFQLVLGKKTLFKGTLKICIQKSIPGSFDNFQL